MTDKLLRRIIATLHRHEPGTQGTLRQLVGEDLWAQVPAPSQQATEIERLAGNLERVRKNASNHLVYRVVRVP